MATFNPPAALSTDDKLTHTWLNSLVSSVETMFDHGLATDEGEGGTGTNRNFSYPLVLNGPLDFDGNKLIGLQTFSSIAFGSAYSSLQAAIDSLGPGGGLVLLESKTYYLSEALRLGGTDEDQDNVILVGMGDGTVIRPGTSFSTARGCIVEFSPSTTNERSRFGLWNVKLDANSRTWGVKFNKATNSFLKDVTIVNAGSSSYMVDVSHANSYTISGCNFLGPALGGISGVATAAGDRGAVIQDNIFSGHTSSAINLDSIDYTYIADNVITGGTAASLDSGIIIQNSNAGQPIHYLAIVNNILCKQEYPVPGTISGLGIRVTVGAAGDDVQYVIIDNNYIGRYNGQGIYMYGENITQGVQSNSRFIISNNVIDNVGREGIYLRQCGAGDVESGSQTIVDNIVLSCSRADGGIGFPIVVYNIESETGGVNDQRSYHNNITTNLLVHDTNDHPDVPARAIGLTLNFNFKSSIIVGNSYGNIASLYNPPTGSNVWVADNNRGWTN